MATRSRTRGQISELIHIAPIKQGYVDGLPPGAPPVRWADRLRTTLEAFNGREDQGFPGVIRIFRGIHSAQWALLDGDTRLLLHVVFDGSLDSYLRALARDIPGMLNMIWSNCEGWEDPRNDAQLLIHFIDRHQVRANFFFAQHPQLTVPDVEGLLRLRDVVDSNTDVVCEPCGRALRAELYRRGAPLSNAQRLKLALTQYGNAELSKHAFERLFGSLYTSQQLKDAIRETYGACTPESPADRNEFPHLAEVQGNILAEYPDAHGARMLFFHFPDPAAARAWLDALELLVTFARDTPEGPFYLNIGFTHAGLVALGVSQTVLYQFPTAFKAGMAARAAELGDPPWSYGDRAPWGSVDADPSKPVHAVVFVHARIAQGDLYGALLEAGHNAQSGYACEGRYDQTARDDRLMTLLETHLERVCRTVRERLPSGNGAPQCLGHRDLHRPLVETTNEQTPVYGVEYFGFRDGVGQPRAPESALCPGGHGLLANASFLVVRQLLQDPKAFWKSMEENAKPLQVSKRELAEQIVGRRMDGRRLDSTAAHFDPERDRHAFDPDRETPGCPFHSHVRRANPRVETSHTRNPTLMRRSLAYLEQREGRAVRGLMFLAFNADIEGQFELIQRNWLQSGNQVGLASRDRDVLTGLPHSPSAHGDVGPARFYAELPDAHGTPSAVSCELQFEQSFVTLEWGMYLYFPARAALHQL